MIWGDIGVPLFVIPRSSPDHHRSRPRPFPDHPRSLPRYPRSIQTLQITLDHDQAAPDRPQITIRARQYPDHKRIMYGQGDSRQRADNARVLLYLPSGRSWCVVCFPQILISRTACDGGVVALVGCYGPWCRSGGSSASEAKRIRIYIIMPAGCCGP